MDSIELAKKRARQAIESTYDCECDIVEYRPTKNPNNKRTEYKEETVLEKQPCRLSYKTISNSNESENESNVTQMVKLFIAPEIQVKPGSKIIVTKKSGLVEEYKNSGKPAVYDDTHQKIILEVFKGWA